MNMTGPLSGVRLRGICSHLVQILRLEQPSQSESNLLDRGPQLRNPVQACQDLRQQLAVPAHHIPEGMPQGLRCRIPDMLINMNLRMCPNVSACLASQTCARCEIGSMSLERQSAIGQFCCTHGLCRQRNGCASKMSEVQQDKPKQSS